ncbi:structural maintenance of chromosomes protein 1A-like isoform X2 [Cataglyphis hispanica]|uniref:structural maintenance of chromosomes protein 1A-like isoform X2 n=1 Tax=Cataglyphis hispanica TaxID=1086592 RepID=UPI00217FAB5C|nr:structural maintenance of chromosomes protein 1A-like isoform X2 [Cataglyphis hispanica]
MIDKMPISLKVITLFNFKSFKGKIVIDNIQPFTAIIGSIGSGKSNIMDAISFVLGGKLSALRVKHLNELVHGAFNQKPTVEGAYVTIIILTEENQEKSYTRMIQKKGSQYKIDNKIVTRDFYMIELKEIGLDIKAGNFLISQGCIQYFATINMPKELTVMFEEISGSIVYKAEYERLQLELLKINQEIHFAYQTKKGQLRRKKSAIIEKTEAEKYLQLQKQYMEEKLKFQLTQLIFMKKKIESLQNKQKNIKLSIDEQLQSKEAEMTSLKHIKFKVKSLSDLLNEIEENIIKLEDYIRKKKQEYINVENQIEYWQKKRNYACTSLDGANNACKIHKKTVKELKDELKILEKLLEETSSENDIVEFHNSQVNRYMILNTEVENRAKDFINHINDLMHDRQMDQCKLDNENRVKEELVSKVKFETIRKEQLKKKIDELQKNKSNLIKKDEERQKLEKEIRETQEKSLKLKNDIAKISEKLAEADINNDIISQQNKKAEIIKNLKEFLPGVYDCLANLCKPIHSRYNVAVTKIFGRNMDAIVVDTERTAKQCINFLKQHKIGVEKFLPLDSIKVKPINERLRNKLQQTNSKLLYDILMLSFIEIDKAVLYVTKNTIVCETAEDARKMAFESGGNYDCVSLDGCSFHRNGIISGGLTALTARAKQWENIQSLSVLKEQKIQLKQELISLPNISHMQSDFDIINKNINQFTSEMEVIEKDIKDITEEIKINETKLNDLHKELSLQDTAISKIQQDMQIKDEMIKNIEKNIDEIKNHIFIDFCKEINVPNITYYEQNLCTYKERLTKKMENINRKNYINNQLTFEKDRSAEFEEKISSWEHNLEKANKEYEKACKQEQNIRTAIEQEEKKLLELKNDYKIKEKYLEDLNKELIQCRSRIGAISELYLETQKAYMATQSTIDQEKAKCETIVKECKLEGITIPILSETIHESSSNSNLSTESLITNIDFSQISEHVRDSTDLQNIIEQSKIKLTEIQNEFKTLQKPNLKAHKKIDLIIQQIKDINRKHEELRIKSNNIGKQFEKIKAKRHKLFSDCLECITAEIDSIYKNLTNDMSAQAFIISENPEEPYTSGINYSCIPSSKRIQPLQNLSDGEKSIANLALLFAILRYKPVPFFIMDEGDAALDNVNINKLIRFIRSKINNMQIIVITLNKRLASRADILIGVTTQPGPKCTESMIFAMPLKNVKNTRN